MSSAQDNKIREIQHADILQSQYHDEITMHENQPCPKTEIPLPGPSGILVMSDEHLGDFSEEACQERIQGSQGTGTSQAKNWLSRNVISGECSPQNSLKIKVLCAPFPARSLYFGTHDQSPFQITSGAQGFLKVSPFLSIHKSVFYSPIQFEGCCEILHTLTQL